MEHWLLFIFLSGAPPQVLVMDDEMACRHATVQVREQFRGRTDGWVLPTMLSIVCAPVRTP